MYVASAKVGRSNAEASSVPVTDPSTTKMNTNIIEAKTFLRNISVRCRCGFFSPDRTAEREYTVTDCLRFDIWLSVFMALRNESTLCTSFS